MRPLLMQLNNACCFLFSFHFRFKRACHGKPEIPKTRFGITEYCKRCLRVTSGPGLDTLSVMLREAPSLRLFASLSCLEYTDDQEGAYEHKESPESEEGASLPRIY